MNIWAWVCDNKTLFTKTCCRLDLAPGPSSASLCSRAFEGTLDTHPLPGQAAFSRLLNQSAANRLAGHLMVGERAKPENFPLPVPRFSQALRQHLCLLRSFSPYKTCVPQFQLLLKASSPGLCQPQSLPLSFQPSCFGFQHSPPLGFQSFSFPCVTKPLCI